MINRRRALIGYLTYFFTTRIAGRIVRKKAGDLGPGSSDNGGTGMLNRTKSAPQAMAARTAMLVAAARPIVERAMNDPELNAAIRQAFDAGREVRSEIKGKPPKTTAKRVARDQKILARVETSAAELQEALSRVLKEPEKKGKLRRVGPVLVVGGAATAVFVFLRKRGGGISPEETPY